MKTQAIASIAALMTSVFLASLAASANDLPANDYPTVARADYVFGCMASNGQTRDALEKCSCSVDVIASDNTLSMLPALLSTTLVASESRSKATLAESLLLRGGTGGAIAIGACEGEGTAAGVRTTLGARTEAVGGVGSGDTAWSLSRPNRTQASSPPAATIHSEEEYSKCQPRPRSSPIKPTLNSPPAP